MKLSVAICSAIACAASASAPNSPITKAAALNSPTSNRSVPPIGSPIRQMVRRRCASGRHQRPKRR